MDPNKRVEWERKYLDALQPKVDEPVLAGGLFHRTGGWDEFLVAVTPTRLHAFRCSTAGGDISAGEELAAWTRAGLTVTAEETAVDTKVVIERSADGKRVVCATGKDELSQSVVHAMQETVGVAV